MFFYTTYLCVCFSLTSELQKGRGPLIFTSAFHAINSSYTCKVIEAKSFSQIYIYIYINAFFLKETIYIYFHTLSLFPLLCHILFNILYCCQTQVCGA